MGELGLLFGGAFNILQVVIGIGFIILIHEFGHFIVARWCGVRCEVFSIGFGPKIFGWRSKKKVDTGTKDEQGKPVFEIVRGDTEYRLSMVPLGGYVKMAGGEVASEETTGAKDEFLSKPIRHRFAILVAGVTMNALAAIVLFVIAYAIGVPGTSPRVGTVMQGPAWTAGVRAGDTITHINGEPVDDFVDINVAIAFSSAGEPITLTIVRVNDAGERETVELDVVPEYNAAAGFPQIGIGAARATTVAKFDDARKAVLEGILELGDVITHVNGNELMLGCLPDEGETENLNTPWPRSYTDYFARMRENTGETVDLTIIRQGEVIELNKVPVYTKHTGVNLGIDSIPLYPLSGVRPNGPAATARTAVPIGDDDGDAQSQPSDDTGDATAVPTASDTDPTHYRAGGSLPMAPGDLVVSINGFEPQSHEAMARYIRALPLDRPALVVFDRPTNGDDDDAATRLKALVTPRLRVDPFFNRIGGVFDIALVPPTGTDSEEAGAATATESIDDDDSTTDTQAGEAAATETMRIRSLDPAGPAASARCEAVMVDGKWVTARDDDTRDLLGTPLAPGRDVLWMINGERVFSWGFEPNWSPGGTGWPGVANFLINNDSAASVSTWDLRSRTADAPLEIIVMRHPEPGADTDTDAEAVRLRYRITPEAFGDYAVENTVGFFPAQNTTVIQHDGLDAVAAGVDATARFAAQVFMTIKSIIVGQVDGKNIGGPILIATASYQFAEQGTAKLIFFIALLSVNLAIINILPIPVLDGGHIVFLGIEALRGGKPVPPKIMSIATYAGLLLLLALIVFVTFNDISRLVTGG